MMLQKFYSHIPSQGSARCRTVGDQQVSVAMLRNGMTAYRGFPTHWGTRQLEQQGGPIGDEELRLMTPNVRRAFEANAERIRRISHRLNFWVAEQVGDLSDLAP